MTRKPARSPLDPPGFKPRDGKPMWIASPRLRAAGWPSSIACKGEDGAYLPLGRARDMARRINEDVARWDRGEATVSFAPHGGLTQAAGLARLKASDRSLQAAFDRWTAHPAWRRLAVKTRRGYANDLKRLLAVFGADHPDVLDRTTLIEWAEAERDRLYAMKGLGWTEERWRAAKRSHTADGTAYVPHVRALRTEHEDEMLANTPGQTQVNNCLRATGALFTFIIEELQWIADAAHPARRLGKAGALRGTRPRLRKPSDAEAAHMIETADQMGLHAVGDIICALAHAGQRPTDLIQLTPEQFDNGRFRLKPHKTRRHAGAQTVDFRPSAILARRMQAALARRAAKINPMIEARANWIPNELFLTDEQGVPFTIDHLETMFAKVRARAAAARAPGAAEPMTSCAELVLYDFRRLAVTRMSESGGTPQRIAAITGHSLKTIDTILKHYSVSTAELADQAMDALDEHLAAKGVKW